MGLSILKTETIFLSQLIHDLSSGTLKKTKKLTKKLTKKSLGCRNFSPAHITHNRNWKALMNKEKNVNLQKNLKKKQGNILKQIVSKSYKE